VSIGDKKLYKTAVKKNTLFPKWNETTTFDVEDDATKLEIVSSSLYTLKTTHLS